MIYTLKDLLMKMGAPEAREKETIEWFYFDRDRKDLAGFAAIRFEAGGERLIAEMKHIRDDYEDDNGVKQENHVEYFYMAAERAARPGHYRVTSLSFDGTHHEKPAKAAIELGLSVFHARALDISLRMIEQSFNKDDMLNKAEDAGLLFKSFMAARLPASTAAIPPRRFGTRDFNAIGKTAPTAVILPFKPRTAVARAS